jgi:hypothetical protein
MNFYKLAAITAVVVSYLVAQSPVPPPRTAETLAVVAQINNRLAVTKLKVGDRVSAKVIQDVIEEGKVIIPRESKLIGHVANVTASKGDDLSRLALVFDQGQLHRGGVLPIHGVIQAVGPPLPEAEPDWDSSSSSYGGAESGHPAPGGLMSNAPANTTYSVIRPRPRRSGTKELEERVKALDAAQHSNSAPVGPHGNVLNNGSHGIFGLPGIFLTSAAPVPTIISVGQNVDLKSGAQIVVRLDPVH